MTIEQKTDHVIEAQDNLVQQFKGKPVFNALLNVYVVQIQELENVLYTMISCQCLDDAIGVQLDGLGSIVNEDRQGRDDDDYRIAIRARIQLNLSEGTPEDCIDLVKAISNGSDVELREYYPAAFTVEILDPIDVDVLDPVKASGFLQKCKPAGVKAQLKYHSEGAFKFDTGPGYDVGKYGGAI